MAGLVAPSWSGPDEAAEEGWHLAAGDPQGAYLRFPESNARRPGRGLYGLCANNAKAGRLCSSVNDVGFVGPYE